MNPPVAEPVFLIELSKISPNPFQPRRVFDPEKLRELANSIREYGILQPLVVTKIIEESETGTSVRYELIAGERRFRASSMIGLERVPAIIKNVGRDRTRLELAIIENVQRDDLNPIESALAYSRLQDEFGLTQREIANRIGKSRESVANTLRLLNLPSEMQNAVSDGRLSESQARLLLSLKEMSQQEQLFQEIINNNLSVRELKAKIQYTKSVEARKKREAEPRNDAEVRFIGKQLETALGTPVKVERNGASGKITIEFYSPEELQGIIQKIAAQQIATLPAQEETQFATEHYQEPEVPTHPHQEPAQQAYPVAPQTPVYEEQQYQAPATPQAPPQQQQSPELQVTQQYLEAQPEVTTHEYPATPQPQQQYYNPPAQQAYQQDDLRQINDRPAQNDLDNFTV